MLQRIIALALVLTVLVAIPTPASAGGSGGWNTQTTCYSDSNGHGCWQEKNNGKVDKGRWSWWNFNNTIHQWGWWIFNLITGDGSSGSHTKHYSSPRLQ